MLEGQTAVYRAAAVLVIVLLYHPSWMSITTHIPLHSLICMGGVVCSLECKEWSVVVACEWGRLDHNVSMHTDGVR